MEITPLEFMDFQIRVLLVSSFLMKKNSSLIPNKYHCSSSPQSHFITKCKQVRTVAGWLYIHSPRLYTGTFTYLVLAIHT